MGHIKFKNSKFSRTKTNNCNFLFSMLPNIRNETRMVQAVHNILSFFVKLQVHLLSVNTYLLTTLKEKCDSFH